MTQGQFLSGVFKRTELSFLSLRLVAIIRLKCLEKGIAEYTYAKIYMREREREREKFRKRVKEKSL